ncbi:uncharacterized protein TNCV_1279831 [Trichonephila clavipes]|nr:uncharacterized protein TNCV_1279831 [Trichonephila clavipes]
MIFYNPTVPTLQQMSFVVIAVKISTDLEVRALMKKYEHASFLIPSKEMHIFLFKKLPNYIPPVNSYGLLITKNKYRLLTNYSVSAYYPDIHNSLSDLQPLTENNLPCMMWEELISKKISSLGLPYSMKSELMTLIRCICIEIDQWQKEHEDVFRFQCIDFLTYFCWNSHGKIDKVKTAKSLINDESLCIIARYNLARRTATAGSDVVQSGRPIFDDFFQHLWPYIGNNTANVVFQMVKRLSLIRIDQ